MMLLDSVRKIIKRCRLIDEGDKIVVGVSGGPDSIALLLLLSHLSKELKITLHIAHLDHRLRKDSCKDKEFVEQVAAQLKVPLTTGRADAKKLNRRGSLEENARNARLGFLFRVAKDTKAAKIALGHNLDDQAETVLMRILRGTGLYGLSGILPKREIAGYKIIRPLLEARRKEIEAYLRKRNIAPRIDASNFEDIYYRNRIRNRLLPLLEKEYNINIKEVLSNMAENIGYDYDYLGRIACAAAKRMKARINSKRLMKLHPAIRRLVLRMNFARLKGDTRRITFQHIKELEDLIFNRPIKSVVDLPKMVSVAKERKYIHFYRRAKL